MAPVSDGAGSTSIEAGRRGVCGWLLLVAAPLAVVVTWLTPIGDPIPSDFQVFWAAGDRFASGAGLYPAVPIDVAFLYPPFAAWLFQLLALVPPATADAVFSLVNAALYLAAIWLVADALRAEYPASRWRCALLASVLLSLPFFQWNAVFGQTNLLTFSLLLMAVALLGRGRDGWSGAAVAVAAGIKVVPAIFGLWLLLRSGRAARRGLIIGAVAVIVIPLIWRGPTQGVADLVAFVDSVLNQFLTGGVRVRADNHNLATLIYGILGPVASIGTFQTPYYLVETSATVPAVLYRVAALIVLAAWLAMVMMRRRRGAELSLLEVVAIFLLGALLSGVTWHHHLVILLLVLAVLFIEVAGRRGAIRWGLGIPLVLLTVASLGRDLVGWGAFDAIRKLHVMRLGLVGAFLGVLLALMARSSDGAAAISSGSEQESPAAD